MAVWTERQLRAEDRLSSTEGVTRRLVPNLRRNRSSSKQQQRQRALSTPSYAAYRTCQLLKHISAVGDNPMKDISSYFSGRRGHYDTITLGVSGLIQTVLAGQGVFHDTTTAARVRQNSGRISARFHGQTRGGGLGTWAGHSSDLDFYENHLHSYSDHKRPGQRGCDLRNHGWQVLLMHARWSPYPYVDGVFALISAGIGAYKQQQHLQMCTNMGNITYS